MDVGRVQGRELACLERPFGVGKANAPLLALDCSNATGPECKMLNMGGMPESHGLY